MTQTHAQLRERIAEVIDREYGSFTCSMTNTEARALAFEVTDLLLPLLSPSDTGLASVVSEIDRLHAAWEEHKGDARQLAEVKLFDNWPLIRQALTTGGSVTR